VKPTGIPPLASVLDPLELAIEKVVEDDIETALERDDVRLIATPVEVALGRGDVNDVLVAATPLVFLICCGDLLQAPIPDPPPIAATAETPACDDALLIVVLLRGDAESPPKPTREFEVPP